MEDTRGTMSVLPCIYRERTASRRGLFAAGTDDAASELQPSDGRCPDGVQAAHGSRPVQAKARSTHHNRLDVGLKLLLSDALCRREKEVLFALKL